MRLSLVTEMLAPAAALAVIVAAARLDSPALLLALAAVWFAPALGRRWLGSPLDERESAALRHAEVSALRLLLVAAAALPVLLRSGGASTLVQEWVDLGFLLLAVFVARATLLAALTLSSAAAAQTVASSAVLVGAALTLGRSWPTGAAPLALVGLSLLPQLLAKPWPRVAALMWSGGALLAAAHALGAGFAPLEVLLLLALLSGPWGVAGWLAARSADSVADIS